MNKDIRLIIRELINKELEEISTSGGAGSYCTPKAFKNNNLNEASYRKFKGKISESTTNQKIRKALREMRSSVRTMNTLVDFSSKLKEEMGNNGTNWVIVKEQIDALSTQISEIQTKLKTLYK